MHHAMPTTDTEAWIKETSQLRCILTILEHILSALTLILGGDLEEVWNWYPVAVWSWSWISPIFI